MAAEGLGSWEGRWRVTGALGRAGWEVRSQAVGGNTCPSPRSEFPEARVWAEFNPWLEEGGEGGNEEEEAAEKGKF